MNLLTLIFSLITICVHILVFVGESIFWLEPVIYEQAVTKIDAFTDVSSYEQAKILEVLFFNQGFYNLFIALGGIAGMILYRYGKSQAGIALICYTCMFAFGASLVLASSTTAYPGSLVQGGPPALAIMGLYLSRRHSC